MAEIICPKCGNKENFHFNYNYAKKDISITDILCNECGEFFINEKIKMDDFNAEKAKQIANSIDKDELNDVLIKIQEKAKEHKFVLHIYRPLKITTTEELTKRGFEIITNKSTLSDLYLSIYWK